MSYQELSITLTLPDGNLDISDLLVPDSYAEDFSLCNENKKSTLDTISFQIRYNRDVVMAIINHGSRIGIHVTDADTETDLFTGYLDPVADLAVVGYDDMDPFRLEAVDATVDLDRLIKEDLSYPDTVGGTALPLYDPDHPDASIISKLLEHAGWSGRISPVAPVLPATVVNVSVVSGEETYREVLDNLMFERGYVLYGLANGTVTWMLWATDGLDVETELGEDDIQNSPAMTFSRKYITADGVTIIYGQPGVIEHARLWEGSTPIGSDGLFSGEDIAAGDYWPEDSDIQEITQEYSKEWLDVPYLTGESRLENDDLTLIATSDWELVDQADEGIALDPISEETAVVFGAKRARLRYKNSAETAKKLYYSRIYGKALIRKAKMSSTVPSAAADPKEYTTRYTFDQVTADALAKALRADQKYGDITYTFASYRELPIGIAYTINQSGLDIATTLIITGRTLTRGMDHPFCYTALAVSEITESIGHGGQQGSGIRPTPIRLITQYASVADGPWHADPLSTDYYMRSSSDGGFTWTAGILFRGTTARSIKLDASSYTVPVSSRGTVRGGNITLVAALSNLPMPEVGLTWNSPSITLSAGADLYHKIADVSTFSLDKAIIAVSVEYEGVAYTSQVGISKSYDGLPAPQKLGAFATLPTQTSDGEPLVNGDYFLASTTFTSGGNVYTVGEIYEYNNGTWSPTSDSSKILAMQDEFVQLTEDTPATISSKVIARRVYAQQAVITEIMASFLEIKQALFAGYTKEGVEPASGAGFWLGAGGKMKAMLAELLGTLRTGKGAATNARVAIQDESGITAGPVFSGAGSNDLAITAEGAVAGTLKVKITSEKNSYNIGDVGPAGGIIYYKSGDFYRECVPASVFGSDTHSHDYCATLCDNLVYGGYGDWVLPTIDELHLMYTNLHLAGLGEFLPYANGYWSSTSGGGYYNLWANFGKGTFDNTAYYTYYKMIRASRSFTAPGDKFKWTDNNWTTESDEVEITPNTPHALAGYDISIVFGSNGGHAINDEWEFTQGAMRGMSIQDADGIEYAEASNGVFNLGGPGGKNLVSEGFCTLTGGLIVKWGSMGSMAVDAIETTTFGVSHGGAFPTAGLGALASAVNASGNNPTLDLGANISATAISLNNRGYTADNTYWFAWGY